MPAVFFSFGAKMRNKIVFAQFKITNNSICNGGWFRLTDKSCLFIRHKCRQASHIRYDHRLKEMVSEGSYSTLSGASVTLYHYISCAEIIFYFTVRDKIS